MTKEQLYSLLASNKIDTVKKLFKLKYDIDLIQKAIKEYDPKLHDVHDPTIRANKQIFEEGNTVDESGKKNLILKNVKQVQRIAAPLQKQIVLLRSAFIGSPDMDSNPEAQEEKDLLVIMAKIWHDNKMKYRFSETTKRTMSELRCAWLFYGAEDKTYWDGQPIKNNPVKPRIKLLSHQLGDTLYPLYDLNDDLIAFAREYEVVTFNDQLNEVKELHLDIYTDDRIYYKKQVVGVWQDAFADGETALKLDFAEDVLISTYKENIVGKIPIIYFSQDQPEWSDVQDACKRIDELLSNHADTNDYFGNPILFGKAGGGTLSLPQKEDAGKYVEGNDKDTDLKFVTWDNAPESIKMELTNLFNVVYDLSNTANISFENMKGLGPMSGFAIQLMFLGATLKAKDCEMSIFGEGVQRAYNYMKKLISILDSKFLKTLSFTVTPSFSSVLPNNAAEILDNINKARNGGILSDETGIEQNPLVKDAEAEKKRIKDEGTDKQAKEIDKQKQLADINKKSFVPATVN